MSHQWEGDPPGDKGKDPGLWQAGISVVAGGRDQGKQPEWKEDNRWDRDQGEGSLKEEQAAVSERWDRDMSLGGFVSVRLCDTTGHRPGSVQSRDTSTVPAQ